MLVAASLIACQPGRPPAQDPTPPSPLEPHRPPADTIAALTPVTVPCQAATLGWRDVTDAVTIARLRAAAQRLSWTDQLLGPPADCQLRFALRCAPDLDGDALPDELARFRWSVPTDDAFDQPCESLDVHDEDVWPAEATIILSVADPTSPRALAIVDYRVADGQTAADRTIDDFVRLPDGRVGLRGWTSHFDSADGCDLQGEWLGVLTPDGFRVLTDTTPAACPLPVTGR